jgi:hypothetical protein
LEAVEFFEGAAVLAFGLGLVAEEEGPTIALADGAQEAIGEEVVAVLGAGDFDIAIAGEFLVHGDEGVIASVEGFVEAVGEEAGLQAGGAEDGLLGEGHAFQGDEFLGVDGLVDGDEIALEIGDFLEVFEADDGEGGCCEAVLDGVLSGAGLTLGSARAGGEGGVGAIGGKLLGGDGRFGFLGTFHGVLSI